MLPSTTRLPPDGIWNRGPLGKQGSLGVVNLPNSYAYLGLIRYGKRSRGICGMALGVPWYDFHSITAAGNHRPIDQQVIVKVFLTLRATISMHLPEGIFFHRSHISYRYSIESQQTFNIRPCNQRPDYTKFPEDKHTVRYPGAIWVYASN